MKNALQAQLLKAGLVDKKQANKISKQKQHQQRTGQANDNALKADIAKAQQDKQARDQALNLEKQQILAEKSLKANIEQMIQQHKIQDTAGDISYQFMHDNKIKKVYINQNIYNGLVAGSLKITISAQQDYVFLPQALALRIDEKMSGFIIHTSNTENTTPVTEDDPYADYVIPDDLMW